MGKDEKREIWIVSGLPTRILGKAYQFPGLQQVVFVRRTYWNGNETILEGRYFVTSLPRNRLSARRYLEKVVRHWEVENSLHLVKDKHWNEDKQYTLRATLGYLQSVLRSAAINVLRVIKLPAKASSLTARALQLLAEPLKALKLITKI